MKLKALLVDDEIHILNNLARVLPWEAMGFEIVGLAKNGVEALKTAKAGQNEPDLILCDIRMPVMDGMTFIQKVREQGLTSEILLLTGYQEFEYARTGIRYGVRDYICKPINYFELEETVRKLAVQIREKREKLGKEQRLNRVATLASEKYLLHLLLGQETEEESVLWDGEEEAEGRKVHGLLLLDLEGYAFKSMSWSVHERKAWNLHIKNAIKEAFYSIAGRGTVLQVREGEWCLIFHSPLREEITRELLEPGFIQLQNIITDKKDMMIRMCLEQRSFELSEISNVYKRMQQVLILSPADEWLPDIRSVGAGDAGLHKENSGSPWQFIERIATGLRTGSHEGLMQVAAELKYYVGHMTESQAGRAEKLLNYMLIHLLREMRELQMLTGEQEEAVWVNLQGSLSVKELMTLVVSLLDHCRDSLAAKKTSETLMISAQSYIQHHLGNDFGIEDIAEYLGISCSYFCLLFKNHFGETFVEYLTKQRIEMAKFLLSGTEKSVTRIGSIVGYQERRYFTKVFQKYTGMTPSEYRQKDSSAS